MKSGEDVCDREGSRVRWKRKDGSYEVVVYDGGKDPRDNGVRTMSRKHNSKVELKRISPLNDHGW